MSNNQNQRRIKIAKRVAEELEDGQIVNLGVGIPTLVPDYIRDKHVFLQSENGLLGMGHTPDDDMVDMDLISASKKPVTMQQGASLFDSVDSFAMIRGGHIDVAVLGALQVNEIGTIANWSVPGSDILGVGGAMDLVAGARKIIITMTHFSKDQSSKLVKRLTYPSSGARRADLIITDAGVFKPVQGRLRLLELLTDNSLEALVTNTDADIDVSGVKNVLLKGRK